MYNGNQGAEVLNLAGAKTTVENLIAQFNQKLFNWANPGGKLIIQPTTPVSRLRLYNMPLSKLPVNKAKHEFIAFCLTGGASLTDATPTDYFFIEEYGGYTNMDSMISIHLYKKIPTVGCVADNANWPDKLTGSPATFKADAGIAGVDLKTMLEYSLSFIYGAANAKYSLVKKNCQHFATGMFNHFKAANVPARKISNCVLLATWGGLFTINPDNFFAENRGDILIEDEDAATLPKRKNLKRRKFRKVRKSQ